MNRRQRRQRRRAQAHGWGKRKPLGMTAMEIHDRINATMLAARLVIESFSRLGESIRNDAGRRGLNYHVQSQAASYRALWEHHNDLRRGGGGMRIYIAGREARRLAREEIYRHTVELLYRGENVVVVTANYTWAHTLWMDIYDRVLEDERANHNIVGSAYLHTIATADVGGRIRVVGASMADEYVRGTRAVLISDREMEDTRDWERYVHRVVPVEGLGPVHNAMLSELVERGELTSRIVGDTVIYEPPPREEPFVMQPNETYYLVDHQYETLVYADAEHQTLLGRIDHTPPSSSYNEYDRIEGSLDFVTYEGFEDYGGPVSDGLSLSSDHHTSNKDETLQGTLHIEDMLDAIDKEIAEFEEKGGKDA